MHDALKLMARNLANILPSVLLLILLCHRWISLCNDFLDDANALLLTKTFLIIVICQLEHGLDDHLEVNWVNESVVVEIIHSKGYFDLLTFRCTSTEHGKEIHKLIEGELLWRKDYCQSLQRQII